MAESPSPATPNERVFSESDEAELLNFLLMVNQASPSPTTTVDAETLDRVAKHLGDKFKPSQIGGKLRRLKSKYRKSRSSSRFKTPHEERLFRISAQIWGKNKTLENGHEENGEIGDNGEELRNNGTNRTAGEGELRNNGASRAAGKGKLWNNGANRGAGAGIDLELERYPYLVAEFSRILPENEVWREGMKRLGGEKLKEMNDRWKLYKHEEAAMVAMKAEIVREQVKLVMETAMH